MYEGRRLRPFLKIGNHTLRQSQIVLFEIVLKYDYIVRGNTVHPGARKKVPQSIPCRAFFPLGYFTTKFGMGWCGSNRALSTRVAAKLSFGETVTN